MGDMPGENTKTVGHAQIVTMAWLIWGTGVVAALSHSPWQPFTVDLAEWEGVGGELGILCNSCRG